MASTAFCYHDWPEHEKDLRSEKPITPTATTISRTSIGAFAMARIGRRRHRSTSTRGIMNRRV